MISKRYLSFINFILAALVILAAAYLVWDLIMGQMLPEGIEPVRRQIKKEAAGPPPGEDHYAVIVSRDLWFKDTFEPPVEPTPVPVKAPPVPPPPLKLMGTMTATDGRSRAIIENQKDRSQLIYGVGDVVAGVKIMEIEQDRVVLDNAGERVVLEIFPDKLPVPKLALRLSQVLRRIGENKWLVSKKGLWQMVNKKLLETMTEDPLTKITVEDVMGSLARVGCRPYYPPGKPNRGPAEGYEVVILSKDHLAARLGIKQGDIIRAVDGELITDKKQAVELLQRVQGESEVVVEVNRGGEIIELLYVVQEELLQPEE